MLQSILVPIVLVGIYIIKCVYILNEYERGVVFTFGRLEPKPRGPGIVFILYGPQKLTRVDQRTVTMDIPSQDVITRDNISVKVNAVLYFRVLDPNKALTQVENYLYATSQIAQTTLRSVCGEAELDDLLSKREEWNTRIQDIIDGQTDPWGIKVSVVEIKHIDLPQEMQRALARQAEAERERRAKIIKAEGEFQAAAKLKEAGTIMASEPVTLQLRYLETLRDIAVEHNSTILFPIPIDIIQAFFKK